MGYFVFWVALSIAVGMYASSRGRGSGTWFLISIFISPILGFIFCAVSPNLKVDASQPSDKTHVRCPKCAEFVLPMAAVCKHCGAELTPTTDHALRLKQQANAEAHNLALGVCFIVGLIFCAFLISKCSS